MSERIAPSVRTSRGGEAPASGAPEPRRARRAQSAPGHTRLGDSLIAGVPANIMRPRLVFCACLFALVIFGIVMVYSASSIEALKKYGDAQLFFRRQTILALVGTVALLFVALFPSWESICDGRILTIVFVLVVLGLLAVAVMGKTSRGAQRWVPIGPFQLQPSEFAKPVLIVLWAKLLDEYFTLGRTSVLEFGGRAAVFILLPIGMILMQPDFGTTVIICFALFAMAAASDMPTLALVVVIVAFFILAAVFGTMESYRIQRIITSFNPWNDEYGDGYQAVIAIMAFASGGIFGRGIGNSTMKYNFLPEAHNDYILAVIGEEVGLVGVLVFFAVFTALIVSAVLIAQRARTKRDRLIVTGCFTLLGVQFLINALGIIGVIPMTGKPLPFISYGGSSIIACLILAGIVIRVSIESGHDARRRRREAPLAVYDESTAGPARVRSARGSDSFSSPYSRETAPAPSSSPFSVVDSDPRGATLRNARYGEAPAGRADSARRPGARP